MPVFSCSSFKHVRLTRRWCHYARLIHKGAPTFSCQIVRVAVEQLVLAIKGEIVMSPELDKVSLKDTIGVCSSH